MQTKPVYLENMEQIEKKKGLLNFKANVLHVKGKDSIHIYFHIFHFNYLSHGHPSMILYLN